MKSCRTIFLVPLVAVMSNPVLAHYNHDGFAKFDQRIERQHKRIKNGVRNGDLTKKEAKKLRQQNRYIKRLNRQFSKDGHLNHHERHTLRRELNLANKRIYRLKHNDRYRNDDTHRLEYGRNSHYDHSHRNRQHGHGRSAQLHYRDNYRGK